MPDAARTQIERLLSLHTPADAKEAADVQFIRQMLKQHVDLMDRHNPAGHITGSALVIDAASGRVLLHYHKSLNRWLQFGGHAEPGETDPAQTALREAREESGLPDLRFFPNEADPRPLDIDVHLIPRSGERAEHPHLDFRYLLITHQADALFTLLDSAEADESRQFLWRLPELWSDANAVVPALDPSLARLIQKAGSIFKR